MAGVGDAREAVPRSVAVHSLLHARRTPPRVPEGSGRGMVTSRDLVPATSSPVCPRCDSELVVPAIAGGPSESVLQLRSSTAPVGRRDASGDWLCRSCGLRWPYERTSAVVASAAGELEPEPSGSPGELIDLVDVPDVQGATGVTSQRVATTIRQAREARGLTISDAAKGTRIGERYLRALEANASLDEFPAPVYARSFLRAYAEFLDLETDGIVRRFDEDHPVHDDQILEPLPDPRPRRRVVAGALAVASLLTLVSMAVARLDIGSEPGPETVSPAPAAADVSPGPSSIERPPPPPRIEGIRATLQLRDRCWVVAVADGVAVQPGTTFEAGARVVFHADRLLELELGSAGAVHLEVSGERVRTGSLGEVVRLELRLKDGKVVTTFV
jgi:transcriptional regulator with XRE-family HTH domain